MNNVTTELITKENGIQVCCTGIVYILHYSHVKLLGYLLVGKQAICSFDMNKSPLINSPVNGHPPDLSLVSAYGNNSCKQTPPPTDTFWVPEGVRLWESLLYYYCYYYYYHFSEIQQLGQIDETLVWKIRDSAVTAFVFKAMSDFHY